jgi:hypothetical protein
LVQSEKKVLPVRLEVLATKVLKVLKELKVNVVLPVRLEKKVLKVLKEFKALKVNVVQLGLLDLLVNLAL